MNLLNTLAWLARVATGNENRESYNSTIRTRRRLFFRGHPPITRIDLSGERNPLTRPPSPRLETEIATDLPQECLLLDVLPLEIRQLIWEEVLGGHYFHLDIQSFVLTGGLCVAPTPNTCYNGGCRVQFPDEKNLLLPILLSCKQT